MDSEDEPSGHTLEQVDIMCRAHVIRAIGAQLGSIFTPWSARRSGPGARRPRPTEATDARIAACCLVNGVSELWTVDRDFSRFPALRTRNTLV